MEIHVDDHLTLTAFRPSDLDHLVHWMNDPNIYRNTLTVPHPYREEDGLKFLAHVDEFERLNGLQKDWAIRWDDEAVIGGIGLMYEHGMDAHRSEIGYWLAKDYRNKGIMTRVISAFVRAMFEHRHMVRLDAHVFCNNPASARILEKARFTKEGTLRKAYMKNGAYRDVHLYAILIEDMVG